MPTAWQQRVRRPPPRNTAPHRGRPRSYDAASRDISAGYFAAAVRQDHPLPAVAHWNLGRQEGRIVLGLNGTRRRREDPYAMGRGGPSQPDAPQTGTTGCGCATRSTPPAGGSTLYQAGWHADLIVRHATSANLPAGRQLSHRYWEALDGLLNSVGAPENPDAFNPVLTADPLGRRWWRIRDPAASSELGDLLGFCAERGLGAEIEADDVEPVKTEKAYDQRRQAAYATASRSDIASLQAASGRQRLIHKGLISPLRPRPSDHARVRQPPSDRAEAQTAAFRWATSGPVRRRFTLAN